MDIKKISQEDLRILIRNTAQKMGIRESVVEKDFWVCFVLDYLYHKSPWRKALTFKGGTSLSKCFTLIERFSEDVDLILDWRLLGYGLNEPWEERSRTKQDKFNHEINAKTEIFLADTFAPQLLVLSIKICGLPRPSVCQPMPNLSGSISGAIRRIF